MMEIRIDPMSPTVLEKKKNMVGLSEDSRLHHRVTANTLGRAADLGQLGCGPIALGVGGAEP